MREPAGDRPGQPSEGAAASSQGPSAAGAAARAAGSAAEGKAGEAAHEAEPRDLGEALARLQRLRGELEEKETARAELYDRLLRERAELENFKRRMQRERSEALRYANEPLLRELLAVIDNLERAVRAAHDAQRAADQARSAAGNGPERMDASPLWTLITGVEMVVHQFSEILGRFGVARVATENQPFDPSHHEALAQVETHEHPSGAILIEHLPGYRLHDRLLRAAQVTVAKPPPGGGRREGDGGPTN